MSEQWHDDHKKAIAEKWTQCPPVTTKVKELIGDEVCMGTYGLVELEVMQLETELAEARAEIEALMFLVKNQRCCRNCGNHASWQFDICGFGENPQDENEGPHCRRNDLKRWRPMEYRRAKEAAERGER
jgi:hypothetical protein